MLSQSIGNGTFWLGDCLEVMKQAPSSCIDLVVTSPPYDNLREYNGYSFNFEGIVKELFRIVKIGGVVVWIVNDATVENNESGTSFRQALYFKEVGFNLADTMIYEPAGTGAKGSNRLYWQAFEYMFMFSKGKHSTFNPLTKPNTKTVKGGTRNAIEKQKEDKNREIGDKEQRRNNIWRYAVGNANKDVKTGHPAVFPETLARDHILSWSNENDLVFDPFGGSGTTAVAAQKLNRKWVTCEISEQYANAAVERIKNVLL